MKRKTVVTSMILAFALVSGFFAGCSETNEAYIAEAVSDEVEANEPQTAETGEAALALAAETPETPSDEELAELLRARVERALAQNDNFTGTILVRRGEEVLLGEAFGMAHPARGIYNSFDTQFHIASITKQFTGAAVLLLEIDGKLNRTDTLDNFFTGHDNLSDVTVEHLLTMRGGFAADTNDMWEHIQSLLEASYTIDDILALSAQDFEQFFISRWDGEVREFSGYFNGDYWLLGRIVEIASGMSFEDFVTERIFTPAGMENSGFGGSSETAEPLFINSLYVEGINIMDIRNLPFSFAFSTGGMVSTVNDLNLWLDAFFGGKLFPGYLIDEIRTGRYNYGWTFRGSSTWSHDGYITGFNSYLIYDRDSDIRITVLTNRGLRHGSRMATALFGALQAAGAV